MVKSYKSIREECTDLGCIQEDPDGCEVCGFSRAMKCTRDECPSFEYHNKNRSEWEVLEEAGYRRDYEKEMIRNELDCGASAGQFRD